jgi:beta-1,4-mannosyltransferase
VPNLFAIWLASFVAKYQVYIDFHNYGYTILNLNVKNRLIIKLATIYEKFFSRKAKRFFCVSDEMKKDLKNNWNIDAITLYDRPLEKEQLTVNKNLFLEKYQLRPIEKN